jgi:spoIIIJ-associated protein
VVAVTGDDNSGGLTTTDTAALGGDVPVAGHQPGAELAGAADTGHDEEIAERDSASSDPATPPSATSAPATPPSVSPAPATPPRAPAEANGLGEPEDQADAAEDADEEPSEADAAPSPPDLEQESEIAADYIEGLLDVADLDGDIDMDVEGDRPVVSVVGATLEELVGPHGEVLEALQELTRLAVHRQTGARSRIMLDVGGYRVRRKRELAELGKRAAEQVSKTGVPQRLQAMTPFERKVIHDVVAAAGLRSESEGEEPDRRVVVLPAGDTVGAGVGDQAAGQGTGS